MRKTALPAIFAAFAIMQGAAFADSLKKVDCSAFRKQANGSYVALKDTSIVDVSDNTVNIGKGTVIASGSIVMNGSSARDLIDKKCAAAAPTQAKAGQPTFFYDESGKPAGPFSLANLRAKIASGAIKGSTLVWKSGTPKWVPAKDLAELSASFGAAAKTTPSGATAQGGAKAANIRDFFVGTWETEGPAPKGLKGPAKMVLTLGPDSKVRGSYTVGLASSGATVSFPVTGTWDATRLPDKQANMILDLVMRAKGKKKDIDSTSRVKIVDHDMVRSMPDGKIWTRIKG